MQCSPCSPCACSDWFTAFELIANVSVSDFDARDAQSGDVMLGIFPTFIVTVLVVPESKRLHQASVVVVSSRIHSSVCQQLLKLKVGCQHRPTFQF